MNWEKKLLAATISLTLALVPLYFLGIYLNRTLNIQILFTLLNLDGENNLVSWYTSVLLFSSFLCLFALSRTTKNRKEKLAWLSLSAIFLLLSIDEIAEMHHIAGHVLGLLMSKQLFQVETLSYAWVIVGLPAVIIIFWIWKKALQHAMPRKAKYAALLGLVCLIIAMLGEILALFLSAKGIYGTSAVTTIEIIIEETFELFGIILFLYSFLFTLKRKTTLNI